MVSSPAVKRYASALYSLAVDTGARDRVEADLRRLAEAIDQTPELQAFLDDPVIPYSKQRAVLERLFAESLGPLTLRFLLFLAS